MTTIKGDLTTGQTDGERTFGLGKIEVKVTEIVKYSA